MSKLKFAQKTVFFLIIFSVIAIDSGIAQRTVDQLVAQGRAKFENGDYQGSILDFTKAIEIDPNDATLYA
ncbi:MAG: tetratricopeptide repeat protein, partial [Thermodesulfobacteriota bacterium]